MLSIGYRNADFLKDMIDALEFGLSGDERLEIEDAVVDNFEEVWASKGVSINGRRWRDGVDLIDTGALRDSLTYNIRLRIDRYGILITTYSPYAQYVDNKYPFMDLSANTMERIGEVYTRIMEIE